MVLAGFTRHTGKTQPVPNSAMVAYRTFHFDIDEYDEADFSFSHVNMPVADDNIDWSDKPAIGRVYDYKIIA